MLCVQETKWKGDRAREIGEGYRLIYCGTETRRNGVGIICNEHEKENVMEVKRCSGRCMMLKLATGEGIINIVSAYAPGPWLEMEGWGGVAINFADRRAWF